MKPFALLFILNLFLNKAQGQKTIDIPEFKNINATDNYPERSVLASYTGNFDILISLKSYSAWGPDHSIKILAHHKSGWYKIEINTDPLYLNNNICYSTNKIDDTIGQLVWSTLNQNHLFDMKDGRVVSFTCAEKKDTLVTNDGKVLEVIEIFDLGSDGPEHEFEIATKNKYKKLYFYSPHELLKRCRTFPEPYWFTTCIAIFEKHLGK